jgi:hypothetical protein
MVLPSSELKSNKQETSIKQAASGATVSHPRSLHDLRCENFRSYPVKNVQVSIKDGEFLNLLSGYRLLKKAFIP